LRSTADQDHGIPLLATFRQQTQRQFSSKSPGKPALLCHAARWHAVSNQRIQLIKQMNENQEGMITMTSTKNIIDRHLQCFRAGDLEGILSDYAPGAVMFTTGGPLVGPEGMRPLFQAMITEFGKPGAAFRMKQKFVKGDYAYILWDAETADNVYEMGTDTFVVREGKIVAQSFTGKITPKR
jgi:ketosteroid isomerase-like protein